MHLITMLGTGNYCETCYVWGDRTACTSLFPVAACEWLRPAKVSVLLTTGARGHKNWERLQEELAGRTELCPVALTDGANEAELWENFRRIGNCATDPEIALDVTHGFRSLPLVGLLTMAFLRASGKAEIRHVLYGAWDARDQKNRSPVFDLTPFLRLLDWLAAVTLFETSGDSRELGELLRAYDRSAGRLVHGNSMADLGKILERLSVALALCRPADVGREAGRAQSQLAAVGESLGSQPHAAPFAECLESLRTAYAPLAEGGLRGMLRQIEWYVERRRALQAVVLAREWLVSLAAERCGMTAIDQREEVEQALNRAALSTWADRPKEDPSSAQIGPTFSTERDRLLITTWQQVADLRNDVAHCGMRANPSPSKGIIQRISDLPKTLERLLHELS